MPSFTITNTRAWHTDTDYVTEMVTINNNVVATQQVFMGDLNNGTYYPSITFGPLAISSTDSVVFSANITNHGYTAGDTTTFLADVLGAVGGIALNVALDDQSTDYITPCQSVLSWVFGLLFPNCDGVVAHPAVGFTGASLASEVAPAPGFVNPVWRKTQFSPGTDSPSGCGSNSVYYENLQIVQTDVYAPPPPPPEPCAGQVSCCGGDVCVAPGHSCPRFCP